MNWRWVSRVFTAIFPWPSRATRKAAVAKARAGAEEAQRAAVRDRKLTRELYEMRHQDHVEEMLDHLIRRRSEGQP